MKPFDKTISKMDFGKTIKLPPPIRQHHVSKLTNYQLHWRKTVSHRWIRFFAIISSSQSIHSRANLILNFFCSIVNEICLVTAGKNNPFSSIYIEWYASWHWEQHYSSILRQSAALGFSVKESFSFEFELNWIFSICQLASLWCCSVVVNF